MENKPLNVYKNKLSQKFKNNEKLLLKNFIENKKRGDIIPKDTLVLMPFTNGEIWLKILDIDTTDKGFSIPLRLNELALSKNISQNYLFWYLKQDFVVEYLIIFVKGSVFPRINKEDLLNLIIPIPNKSKYYDLSINELIIKIDTNPFRTLISSFYQDYRLNYEKERYKVTIIIAGAITEGILYQLLLENNVDSKMLENDNNLALGRLIQYVRLLKLDKKFDLPMNAIQELKNHRNNAVHVGLAIKKKVNFKKQNLECFNDIIKYFGI